MDLLAWDLFLGLSLLFASRVFKGDRLHTAIRLTLTLSGALCVAGILGPELAIFAKQTTGKTAA